MSDRKARTVHETQYATLSGFAHFDTRISLHKLEVLCTVVESGGFGRAAHVLCVTQPVVTSHIRSLQERLGVNLFYRDGRSMRLTEEGTIVYQWARELLSRSHEMLREVEGLSEGTRGSIVIASSMSVGSYLLPPILADLAEKLPLARITLHTSQPENAIASVQAGDADLAVLMTDGRPETEVLVVEQIGEEELVLATARGGQPRESSIPAARLAGLPFISSPSGLMRRRLVEHALATLDVNQPRIVIELGHPEAMKSAIRGGLGVGLLFRSSVKEELEAGVLREVSIAGVRLTVPIFMVLRRGKRLSPLQQRIAETIRTRLAAQQGPR